MKTRILFLDIEGVMTRGMLRQHNPELSLLRFFNNRADGDYSAEATRLVRALVREHGFRIVLITRQDKNDSDALNRRMRAAGIRPDMLYAPDPEAIPSATQHKGDAVAQWFTRNPAVSVADTIAIEDNPDGLMYRNKYPSVRIIRTDPDKGFVQADYERLLQVFETATPGVTPAVTGTVTPARRPTARPARRVE